MIIIIILIIIFIITIISIIIIILIIIVIISLFNRFAHPGGPSDPCFFDSLLSCVLVFIDFGIKILRKYVQMRFRMGFGGCMGPFASPGGPLGSCLGLLRAPWGPRWVLKGA